MRTGFALLTFLLWLAPAMAVAQAQPALVVTLRDGNGHGVAGVTVTIRDQAGREVFSGVTDAQGQVALETVPAPELRVAVSGTVGGVNLVQLGDDAEGVQLYAPAPPVTLDLRIDAGGVVLPDPATMIQPEPVEVPTAPIGAASTVAATTSVGALPTAALPASAAATTSASGPASAAQQEDAHGQGVIIGLIAIAIVLAGIVVVLMHERRVA